MRLSYLWWFFAHWRLSLSFVCAVCLLPQASFANKSGVAPSVLVLPKGPGSLGGIGENVQANLNMGLMSYRINVKVPAGRGSATPNPSIVYSSSGGSGILGIGWRFSAGSSITRGTVRGLPTYTNEDVFFAGGELVKLPNGPFYRSRYESGFVRYEWKQKDKSDQGGYWIAEYPDGSKHYYGANSEGKSQPSAQISGNQGTYEWELVTKVDRNGNRVEYTYTKDGTKTYPDTISWVFDKQNKPLYQIRFYYGARKDYISDCKPGFDVQTKKRLERIEITSAGNRFRSYHFAFEDATGLSRLSNVTRFGRDATKAYPVQFSMKYSDATLDETKLKVVVMPTKTASMSSNMTDFVDINGDGLPDLVDTSSPKHVFYINQLTLDKDMKQAGHDFPKALVKQNPNETSAKLSNASVQLLDVNGDGFTDLVDAVNMKIYANKGNGKWEDTSETLVSFPVDGKNPDMRFFDYNGDKKIDVIASDGSSTNYWINDGKGSWVPLRGVDNIGLSFSKDKLRLIDMNGDGLQDAVHVTSSQLRYKKYLGYGKWSEWINVSVEFGSVQGLPLNQDAQFQDVNGDGMADMVLVVNNKIYYMVNSNGNRFSSAKELQTGSLSIPDKSGSSLRIVDINGNGSRDIVWVGGDGKVTYLELFDKRPNLMTEISNGIGQRISVKYGSSVFFKLRDDRCDKDADKGCAGPWENKMPMPFQVVTEITTWASRKADPLAQNAPTDAERPSVQKIYYHHGFYDGKEKKFRGFRHVESLYDGDASMLARKWEIKYDVGDKDPYMHGRLLERSTTDNLGKTYRKQTMTYADCPVELGGIDGKKLLFPIRFICQTAQEILHIEGLTDQSKWRLTRTEQQYDGFGNVVLSANLGEKDKDGDEQVTKTTYIVPANPQETGSLWFLRYPSKVERCASASGPCSLTEMYYDGEAFKGLPLGQISKGNVSRVRQRVKDGKWIEPIRNEYDDVGNLIATKSATDQRKSFVWDELYRRFPSKETIHMEGYTLIMSTMWDYAQSRVTQSTDPNGQVKKYTYDTFGRLTQIFQPGDGDKASVSYEYKMAAPLSQIITRLRSKQGGAFDRENIQCFDGLGRKVSTLTQVDGSSYIASGHQEYNREGQPARLWYNYQSDGKCAFVAPQGTSSTAYFYDGLGRVLRAEHANGDVSRTVFAPLKIVRFDTEDTKESSPHHDTPTTTLFDGLGRTVKEISIPAKGKEITRSFRYSNVNVEGRQLITEVTLADGSIKKQIYDELGNTLQVIDPDRGKTTYTYTPDNQIASIVDARGVKIVFTYDGLKRLLTRMEDGKKDTTIAYLYDRLDPALKQAKFLKGRVVKVVYPGGLKLFSYDERGNTLLSRHRLMGHDFDFVTSYDNLNLATSVTLPDGRRLETSYDGMGRVKSVKGKLASMTYLPNGQIKAITFANKISTAYKYDARYRVVGIDVDKVMSLTYTLDGMGNPTSIQQKHGDVAFTNSYTYDNLYRLTQAEVGANKEVLKYTQDALHNMIKKISSIGSKSSAHIGDFDYDSTKIHAVTKAGEHKLTYDKAGNMTGYRDDTMTWDHLRRIVSAQRGGKDIAKYWYGESSRRVVKEEDGIQTFYVNGIFELRDGVCVSYIKSDLDRLTASWSASCAASFFDDIDKDKIISGADAWRYHAQKQGWSKASLKQRPWDLDLTKTMLASSAHRMLLGGKEVTHYYHADTLGNVRAVTDDSGQVVQRKHYYPYGAIRSVTGHRDMYSRGFQGQEYDKALGVWAFLMRSLNPRLGRWLSADPAFAQVRGIGDEFNSYGMVENNPIAYRDRDGLNKTKNEINQLKVQIDNIEKQIKSKNQQLIQVKSEIGKLNAQQSSLNSKMNQIANTYFSMDNQVRGMKRRRKQDVTNAAEKASMGHAPGGNRRDVREASNLYRKVEKSDAKRRSKESGMGKLANKHGQLGQQIANNQGQINTLKNQKAQLTNQIGQLKNRKANLVKQRNAKVSPKK